MKPTLHRFLRLAAVGVFFIASVAFCASTDGSAAITSHVAEIDGVKLHYMIAGHGPAVVLLHGYAETSLMWKPIIPALAERFTVIAPDLPGIGDSAIPADGLGMKSAAIRMHALVRSLGVEKAEVVGHDIGLMVAYAYAAQFPQEVTKLVVMDAFLPGVGDWGTVYNNPTLCISGLMAPLQKLWCRAWSASTLTTIGTNSRPTRIAPFPRLIAKPMPRHTPGPDACAQVGHTSSLSRRRPRISPSFPKPSSPCQSSRLAARSRWEIF